MPSLLRPMPTPTYRRLTAPADRLLGAGDASNSRRSAFQPKVFSHDSLERSGRSFWAFPLGVFGGVFPRVYHVPHRCFANIFVRVLSLPFRYRAVATLH